MEAKINEIFSSIQGEGPVVGYKQLFIRFCGCNLHCDYCDTEFQQGTCFSPQELYSKIVSEYDLSTFHSISLTGGEPLISVEFLKDFLPIVQGKTKIYLETNATIFEKLPKVKNFLDIISADIKLPTSTGFDTFDLHKKFFSNCGGIETFAKIVFDKNITEEEIETCAKIGKDYNIELVLQPKMVEDKMTVNSEFCTELLDKCTQKYKNTRLIPQVHKLIDVQ